MTLLKAILSNPLSIHSLYVYRSVDVKLCALDYAIIHNNFEAIKLLIEKPVVPPLVTYGIPPTCSIGVTDTGTVDRYTYNHPTRNLAGSRGGKEGNDAFTKDTTGGVYWTGREISVDHVIETAIKYNASKECFQLLMTIMPDFDTQMADMVVTAVRAGNREIAGFLVETLFARGGWGFNILHKQALNFNTENFDKIRPVSVTKKPINNATITPIHVAAINPNPKYLKELLAVRPEFNILDFHRRTPAHYAAGCSTTGPLEFLLNSGVVDINYCDSEQVIPLMIAAGTGRTHNIELILNKEKEKKKEEEDSKIDEKESGDIVMKDAEDKDEDDGEEEKEGEEETPSPRKKKRR